MRGVKGKLMPKNIKRIFCLVAVFTVALVAPEIRAQMTGDASAGSSSGSMGSSGSSSTTSSNPGFTNKSDLIGAVAPPFDIVDVLRMQRVGLQDEVIVNALRSRYHPLILTDEERNTLKTHGVSDRVIVALEDPYGIGIQNVRTNMQAAEAAEAPPVAQTAKQAEDADPHKPTLKTRPPAGNPDSSGQGGQVYVGQSNPSQEPINVSPSSAGNSNPPQDSMKVAAAPPAGGSPATQNSAPTNEASLDIPHAPVTNIAPQPVMKVVSKPIGPGVYLRHGSDWERVDEEPVFWRHHGDKDQAIDGSVLRPESATQTYPGGSDFLIITTHETSAIQYELVRFKSDADKRTFKPAPSGEVYNAGGGDLVHFDPQQLGPSSWLVSIHDVAPGEYGFLPPVTSQVHSTTNLATTLYTFRVK
jgi:hypothetical protein